MTMGSREEVEVDVKALTAAYERKLASLKTKPNKPIAKLRRRLLSSISVNCLATEDHEEEMEEASKKLNRVEKALLHLEYLEKESPPVFDSPRKPTNPSGRTLSTPKSRSEPDARYTGSKRASYTMYGYGTYYDYIKAEEFRVVLEEFREILRSKKSILKPTGTMDHLLPVKDSPKPEETLKRARRKLRRATFQGSFFYNT